MKAELKELTTIINDLKGRELTPPQKKILLSLVNVKKAMERMDKHVIEMEHEVERICRSNINNVIEVDNLRSKLIRIKLEKK